MTSRGRARNPAAPKPFARAACRTDQQSLQERVVATHNLGQAMNDFPMTSSSLAGQSLGLYKLPQELAFSIAGGCKAEVWDRSGNRYLDFLLGSGPMVLGHAHPRVVEAIAAQAARGTHFYQVNDRAIELADRIVSLVPCADAVRFCSDGSEATFYALRMARAFTGRSDVLKFGGAFHGHHDYAQQELSSQGRSGAPVTEAASSGIPPVVSESVHIAPFNDLAFACAVARANSEKIAAILVEPIQRCLLPQPGFLQGLRALADEIGALLIFDEVVTGFRVALGGCQELYEVRPDLCALGKILGGGTPLAAVAGRCDILDLADPDRSGREPYVYMSGTLNGNPLGCAAALATLQILEEMNGPAELKQIGETLAGGILDIARTLDVELQVLGAPSFPQIVFSSAPITKAAELKAANHRAARAFGLELIRRRVLVNPDSKLYIGLSHDQSCQARFLDAARAAMLAVRDQGLL